MEKQTQSVVYSNREGAFAQSRAILRSSHTQSIDTQNNKYPTPLSR